MEINTPAVIGPGEFFPVVGVGPHEKPWPTGAQYDPELLENGGAFIGMNSFGASGPYKDVYKKFGITADAAVAAAKKLLKV